MSIKVAALYQFARVPDPQALRLTLLALAEELGLKGTLILAHEGINGTLACETAEIDAFVSALRTGSCGRPAFDAMEIKYAPADAMPFQRLKIKHKPEIVTLGAPEANPSVQVGIYVSPLEWNALIDDPDVLLIDTRNSFEIGHGTFPGAIDPGTERFGQFPHYVESALDPAQHRKVAMFCTGGIRCEKASALMLARGFETVYHLKGGILGYLEHIPAAENRWQGECFVFDERRTVDQDDITA